MIKCNSNQIVPKGHLYGSLSNLTGLLRLAGIRLRVERLQAEMQKGPNVAV